MKLLPYVLYGINDKYKKKQEDLRNSKKGRLEWILKSTACTLQEGAEFTIYRGIPTLGILIGMGAVIADLYKVALGSFVVSGLIVYQDIKRAKNAGTLD